MERRGQRGVGLEDVGRLVEDAAEQLRIVDGLLRPQQHATQAVVHDVVAALHRPRVDARPPVGQASEVLVLQLPRAGVARHLAQPADDILVACDALRLGGEVLQLGVGGRPRGGVEHVVVGVELRQITDRRVDVHLLGAERQRLVLVTEHTELTTGIDLLSEFSGDGFEVGQPLGSALLADDLCLPGEDVGQPSDLVGLRRHLLLVGDAGGQGLLGDACGLTLVGREASHRRLLRRRSEALQVLERRVLQALRRDGHAVGADGDVAHVPDTTSASAATHLAALDPLGRDLRVRRGEDARRLAGLGDAGRVDGVGPALRRCAHRLDAPTLEHVLPVRRQRGAAPHLVVEVAHRLVPVVHQRLGLATHGLGGLDHLLLVRGDRLVQPLLVLGHVGQDLLRPGPVGDGQRRTWRPGHVRPCLLCGTSLVEDALDLVALLLDRCLHLGQRLRGQLRLAQLVAQPLQLGDRERGTRCAAPRLRSTPCLWPCARRAPSPVPT